MVRFLLDTHALLWALTAPDTLGTEARRIISDKDAVLVVSAASAWEISTKQRLGKLPEADVLVAAYERHLTRLGTERLPITDEHALLSGSFPWEHRDPFDRMLAAQAMIESLPLLTNDPAFERVHGIRTIW